MNKKKWIFFYSIILIIIVFLMVVIGYLNIKYKNEDNEIQQDDVNNKIEYVEEDIVDIEMKEIDAEDLKVNEILNSGISDTHNDSSRNIENEQEKNSVFNKNNMESNFNNQEEIFDKIQENEEEKEHIHEYIKYIEQEPTCTENGNTILKCDCGDIKEEVILAQGHNFVSEVIYEKELQPEYAECYMCDKGYIFARVENMKKVWSIDAYQQHIIEHKCSGASIRKNVQVGEEYVEVIREHKTCSVCSAEE